MQAIAKENWKSFFRLVSRSFQGGRVEVEIAGPDFGDQLENNRATLDGLSFDEKDGAIYIHTEQLDHAVPDPREVTITHEGVGLQEISILDGEGLVHSVRFREPLALLPPAQEEPTQLSP